MNAPKPATPTAYESLMRDAEIARRAKAYPKLVAAVQACLELIYSSGDMSDSRTYKIASDLLRELGEAK